jgi:hypothetical protein
MGPKRNLALRKQKMLFDLYNKRNDRKIVVYYPVHGTKNILRKIEGVKVNSFTGPHGRGITVKEKDGTHRSLSLSKCVVF